MLFNFFTLGLAAAAAVSSVTAAAHHHTSDQIRRSLDVHSAPVNRRAPHRASRRAPGPIVAQKKLLKRGRSLPSRLNANGQGGPGGASSQGGSGGFGDSGSVSQDTSATGNGAAASVVASATSESQATAAAETTSAAASTATSSSSSSSSSSTFTGKATFFYQGGVAGACGTVNSDSALIVALDQALYASSYCGKKVYITNTSNGKSVQAVVADECPGCSSEYSLDLSTGTFDSIGDESTGVLDISWYFMD